MTREDAQRSTDGQDVLNLANSLAGLRTSEDAAREKEALRGAFNPEKANTPDPVLDVDDDDDDDDGGLAPAEGILDEPEEEGQGPPKEDCILFVGDLARAISDADLERAFASMGKVVMVDIKRDKLTGRNLGYGFVQMSTREEAVAARERMQGAEIQGRRIRVGWAQRNTTLFVGDLDETVTAEALAEAFGRFGQLLPEHTYVRSGKFGRYGGVRFKSRQDAETARREMNSVRLGAYPIRVAWHYTQPGGPNAHHGAFMGGGGPARPYSVHVQFEADPNQVVVSESMIHGIFAPFGEVMAVILPQGRGILSRDEGPNGPCCRGYGFVHFSGTALGRKCALEAIRALNGQAVHGVRLSTCFSKKPTGGPRPSSAPPGRMGGRPSRPMMVMDHHAGGVGDVAMGFRPIAMPSPTDPSGGMGFGGGGYPGMDGPVPAGGARGGGGGPWVPMQPGYAPGPGPHSGNSGSPGLVHGRGPPQPYPAYGYGPYPPYAGYPPQPHVQHQPQYFSGHAYGGYNNPYPMYHQPMPPAGGPDGPMPPPPPYMQQRSASNGGPGSSGPGSGPGSGDEQLGGVGPYGDYGGPPPPAGMHPMGPGCPMPPSAGGGHPPEAFPAGL